MRNKRGTGRGFFFFFMHFRMCYGATTELKHCEDPVQRRAIKIKLTHEYRCTHSHANVVKDKSERERERDRQTDREKEREEKRK